MSPPDVVQVVSGDLPTGLFRSYSNASQVAWDVETSGLDWRHDRLATCQLFAPGVGAVIVSLTDLQPPRLSALLEDLGVEKIFHHAPFDLRFMVHAWKVRPGSIRCTKVASKLLSPDVPADAHSLQGLVSRHFGIVLNKSSVRTSDWSSQSLTDAQIEYASEDVLHLPALLEVLEKGLVASGLKELYDDCCAFLPARVRLDLGDYPDVFAY